MWDRRVVRGSTYSAQVPPPPTTTPLLCIKRCSCTGAAHHRRARPRWRTKDGREEEAEGDAGKCTPRAIRSITLCRAHRLPGQRRTNEVKPAPRTPDAVDGRRHMDMQTETYLEEISDRPLEESLATQTDQMMDRCAAFVCAAVAVRLERHVTRL